MTTLRRRSLLIGSAAATLGAPAIVRAQSGRLAQGTDQDHRALPAGRLDRSGGAHHPGQADREHGLEHHRRQQAGRHRRGRLGGRRQVAARRPDLDDHLRQPHPQPGLHAQPALQGLRAAQRHADRPHAAGHRRASRPALQDLRRGGRGCEEAAGQGQHGRARRQPGAGADDPHQERERRRPQPDPLQGRRPAQPGHPGRRHRHRDRQHGIAQPAFPRQQGPADRRHRREAHACAARHADADRAGHQGLIRPIRGGASMRRPARRGRSSSA